MVYVILFKKSHFPNQFQGDSIWILKKVCMALIVFSLLVGSVCAASVNDYKVDSSLKQSYNGNYSLFLNDKQDAGVAIFKNVDDDVFGDVDDDVNDAFIHDDGREYIVLDDDMKLDKNADNTANFTDYDHAEHGVVEVVSQGGEQFIVVFWAKDNSNVTNADLMAQLTEFNKANNVSPVAF